MKVKLISVTKPVLTVDESEITPEGLIAYCARASSPNQENPNYAKLLKYCADHGHWSVFEMVDMTVEIETSRAISPQLLRHKSFSFQEFSQRYSRVSSYEVCEARRQDDKNRQNSIDDLSFEAKASFLFFQEALWDFAYGGYLEAIEQGVAKECARMLLPLNTKTKLYMKGSVRSWIHYFDVRCDEATQLEHQQIAVEIKKIFIDQFPVIAKAIF